MKKLIYSIKFTTYWHAGSGLSGGVGANAVVIKDDQGLPFIPGRTLKGMLRDAAENLHELNDKMMPSSFIETVFGVSDEDRKAGDPYDTNGTFFGNADLSRQLQQSISAEQKPLLYTTLASTAIDQNGQAIDQTLRQIEVAVPLTLYASIIRFPDEPEYLRHIQKCFQWIKRMGTNRNRGLGRCQFTLLKTES